ncbi:MAG: hypothetical protein IPG71_03055 [bacterium]|nr:hypothetical protein [bacterium]
MTRKSRFLLFIICVWVWTDSASAQILTYGVWGADFGRIAINDCSDSARLAQELSAAVDSLAHKRGILLDLSGLSDGQQMFGAQFFALLSTAFSDYTKPTVALISRKMSWNTLLGEWVKSRYWTRVVENGSQRKAEARLKTLYGRYLKEGQERMDWLTKKGTPK